MEVTERLLHQLERGQRCPRYSDEQRERMPLVIWRLPHPVRGIFVFLGIFVAGSALGGFGMGIPELAVLGLLAVGVALVVATRTTSDDNSSS